MPLELEDGKNNKIDVKNFEFTINKDLAVSILLQLKLPKQEALLNEFGQQVFKQINLPMLNQFGHPMFNQYGQPMFNQFSEPIFETNYLLDIPLDFALPLLKNLNSYFNLAPNKQIKQSKTVRLSSDLASQIRLQLDSQISPNKKFFF